MRERIRTQRINSGEQHTINEISKNESTETPKMRKLGKQQ